MVNMAHYLTSDGGPARGVMLRAGPGTKRPESKAIVRAVIILHLAVGCVRVVQSLICRGVAGTSVPGVVLGFGRANG